MDPLAVGLVMAVALLALLAAGMWVSLSLLAVGLGGLAFFTSAPAGQVLATSAWGASNGWALAALPMFIWMGEILYRSRLAEDLFAGLEPWLAGVPGRLLHVNILGCGLFAAVSGSSAATAMTIGRMTIPELEKRGYDPVMAVGTLAGSATLGLLIPPSIILIVYGVAAEQSIARLFIAGIVPGLMLVLLFMGYVMVRALRVPVTGEPEPARLPLADRWRQSARLLPVLLLIGGVIGSIYAGIASPTDAAAIGVLLSLLLARARGSLDRRSFADSLMAATRTSCMIAFILAGAAVLTVAMGFTGIPRALAQWVGGLGLAPILLVAVLTLVFIVLGCFLDGISVVVLTASVVLPMVREAGIDLVWFGIYLVLVVEMAQITPPVGFNLFVLQGLTGRDILYVAKAALPFFFLLLVAVVLIAAFPEIVTFLPSRMAG